MAKHSGLGVEERFFDHPRESSTIKQKFVVDYFLSWANVMARNRTVGYADLFAGPGRDKLLEVFAGRTLTFKRLLEDEAPETQYTNTTYRDAVLRLEAEFRIEVYPQAPYRRLQAGSAKRTLPEDTKLTFPT